MSSLWRRVTDLPLQVDAYSLEGLQLETNSGFQRQTTEVWLEGAEATGRGEDVSWSANAQIAFRRRGASLPLAGHYTLGEFCANLDCLDLYPEPVPDPSWRHYRRWAFESAALDLALRQGDLGIEGVLGRHATPLHFAVSLGLHDFAPIAERLAIHPNMHFKLDATPEWSNELCAKLAALGTVQIVDFKGAYVGMPVETAVDLDLYRRVLEALPDVIVEDPHSKPAVLQLLKERGARIAWDAPIHSMADVDAMPAPAVALNIKPSRFGRLQRLFEAYDCCTARNLPMYGGGQFELGVGRRQIQLLASLFYPTSSNDVAPRGYHNLHVNEARPARPVAIEAAPSGFDLRH